LVLVGRGQMGIHDDDKRYAIYRAHRADLVKFATPIAGSREEAEDIVQEAFVRFTPGHAANAILPRAYLTRIVRNLALNLRKRKTLEKRHVQDDVPYWGVPQAVQTPEQHMLYEDQVKRVAFILSQMPDQSRIAVEMHRFDGCTMEEIAERLGTSVSSVHRLLRSAMAELTSRLNERS
jgi:RNA polymerase sigma factor (sigma-70 family)